MSVYAQEKLRLPLIRKVFRQADSYICGLCKTDYKDYGAANSCMNQCWFDIHHFFPVVRRKRGASTWTFRCLFCCRDYTNEMAAYTCAKRCIGDKNKAQLQEQLLNEQPLPPPSRPVSRLVMLARVEASAVERPAVKAAVKPQLSMVAKDEAEAKPIADVKAPEVFRGLHKKSFAKQITRKGEKYQCLYCREVHFTKVETQACFDGHFAADGYEKVVSIDPNA